MAPYKDNVNGRKANESSSGPGGDKWPKILENPDLPCEAKFPIRRLELRNKMQVLLISTNGSPSESCSYWAHKFPLNSNELSSPCFGNISKACMFQRNGNSNSLDCSSFERNLEENDVAERCNFAVVVNSGSSSDPANAQGMAHFLEHLVHFGSEKYPEDDSLNKFASDNNSSSNAWTDREITCYFNDFNYSDENLLLGLDMYADKIFHPKLDIDLIQKEILSIENELQYRRSCSDFRISQLINTLAIPGEHPLKKFMCGSIASLFPTNRKAQEFRNDILKFHKDHYTPDNMALVIQAPTHLDMLQNYVMETFGSIQSPSTNLIPRKVAKSLMNPYSMRAFNRLITIKPGYRDMHSLELFWALPPEAWKEYKTKPMHYIAEILTNWRPGGLRQLLSCRGWAMEMDAGAGPCGSWSNEYTTLFNIHISLTQKGRDEVSEVLEAVFTYLRFLKEEGIKKSVFQRLKSTADLMFRSYPLGHCATVSSTLAKHLLSNFEKKHLITGNTLYFENNPDIIRKYLDELRPGKACYVLVSADIGNFEYMTEQWYDAKYIVQDLEPAMLRKFQAGNTFFAQFRNEPSTFSIDFKKFFEIEKTDSVLGARYIESSNHNRLKFFPTSPIATPQSMYNISIFGNCCPKIARTKVPAFEVYSSMWALIANKKSSFIEHCQLGTSVGIHFNPDPCPCFLVEVVGFNIIAKEVVKTLMDDFFSQYIDEEELRRVFDISKEYMLHIYFEQTARPQHYATDLFRRIKRIHSLCAVECYDELKKLTFQDVKNVLQQFKSGLFIESLATGAVTEAHAQEVLQYLETKAWPRMGFNDFCKLRNSLSMPTEIKLIPLGERCLRLKSLLPKEKPFVLLNYYQMGTPSRESNLITSVITQLILDTVKHELRTKEQLGYFVHATMFSDVRNGIGILVMANSDRHSICHINNRIENCIQTFFEEKLTRKNLLPHLKAQRIMKDPSYIQEYARKYLLDKGTTNNQAGYRKVSIQVCHENMHNKCDGKCCHRSKWLKPLFHVGKENAEVCVAGPWKSLLRNAEVYFIESSEAFQKYPGK